MYITRMYDDSSAYAIANPRQEHIRVRPESIKCLKIYWDSCLRIQNSVRLA